MLERRFASTVEEVCHVGVLFSLGNAELAESGIGHHLAERMLDHLRWKRDRNAERAVVFRHAHVVHVHRGLSGTFGRSMGECARDLARAVRTEVEVDDRITVLDASDGCA